MKCMCCGFEIKRFLSGSKILPIRIRNFPSRLLKLANKLNKNKLIKNLEGKPLKKRVSCLSWTFWWKCSVKRNVGWLGFGSGKLIWIRMDPQHCLFAPWMQRFLPLFYYLPQNSGFGIQIVGIVVLDFFYRSGSDFS